MPTHEFLLRRRVQFYETDVAGFVHFSWFYRYMEEAEHALWRAAGLSIHPPESELGWPRVAASFDFQRPLRFEDEFDVHLRIAELARKTIRYECRVEKDGQPVANGTMTIACVRKAPTMRAVEIPQEVVERLSAANYV
jgi:YbgC/YbaW family acyl-CoA thioester hydrolase